MVCSFSVLLSSSVAASGHRPKKHRPTPPSTFLQYKTTPPRDSLTPPTICGPSASGYHDAGLNAPLSPVEARLTQKSLSNLSFPPPAYSISICLPHSSIYIPNHLHHAHPGNWRSVQKSLSNSLSFNTKITPIHAACLGSSSASQYAEPCSGKQPILDAFVIRSIVPRPKYIYQMAAWSSWRCTNVMGTMHVMSTRRSVFGTVPRHSGRRCRFWDILY